MVGHGEGSAPTEWEPGPNASFDEIVASYNSAPAEQQVRGRQRYINALQKAAKRKEKKGKGTKVESTDDDDEAVDTPPNDFPEWDDPAFEPHFGYSIHPPAGFPSFPTTVAQPGGDKFHPVEKPQPFDGKPKSFLMWRSNWQMYINAHEKGFRNYQHVLNQIMSTIPHGTSFSNTIAMIGYQANDPSHELGIKLRRTNNAMEILNWIMEYIRQLVVSPVVFQECNKELYLHKGKRTMQEWIVDMEGLSAILNIDKPEIARIMISKMDEWKKADLVVAAQKDTEFELSWNDIRQKGPLIEARQKALWQATQQSRERRNRWKGQQSEARTGETEVNVTSGDQRKLPNGKFKKWDDEDFAIINRARACRRCLQFGCEIGKCQNNSIRGPKLSSADKSRLIARGIAPPNNL